MHAVNRNTLAALAAIGTLAAAGCASMQNKERAGVIIGTATGAAAGAVAGNNTGSTARGAIIGAVLGWHRGKLIRIERDAETGELRQRASPLAMLLLLAIVALKLGARAIFGESAAAHPGNGALLLTDAFVGFALGLLSATRLELYLRARRILETA